MVLAKVIGTVVSTRKEESMQGMKFLLLKQVDLDGKPAGGNVVAVDDVSFSVKKEKFLSMLLFKIPIPVLNIFSPFS